MRLLFAMIFLASPSAWAWGRRGHALVCENAAYLVAADPKADFLKNHSFDLSYYCNIPDFIWKEPATSQLETFNHYMNREVFEREIGHDKLAAAYAMDRKTFDKTYPKVPEKAGRAYWRIREMDDTLMSYHDKLVAGGVNKDERRSLQGEWLKVAGFMGHYIGDLSMPLHVTENHNGSLTHQEGIHSFYEDVIVNELAYDKDGFNLSSEVQKAAALRWSKDRARLAQKSVLDLMQEMTAESSMAATELFKVDKETGRDLAKAKKAHKPMIVKNLAMGAVYLAEFYRRGVGFDFDDERFFNFTGTPAFIPTPK
jgi:hypothetical protein